MTPDFDPYHHWLGIPAEDQPADHYRLLGVKQYESNPSVIDNAADRQMAHLKSVRTGKFAPLAERVLNEVAKARVSLLNAEAKAAYDRQLRDSEAAAAGAPLPHVTPFAASPRRVATTGHHAASASSSSRAWLLAAIGGGAACALVVAVVAAIVMMNSGRSDNDVAANTNPPVVDAAHQSTDAVSQPAGDHGDKANSPAVSTPVAPAPTPPAPTPPADGSTQDADAAKIPAIDTRPSAVEPPPSDVVTPPAVDPAPPTVTGPPDTASAPVVESNPAFVTPAGDQRPGIVACRVLETKRTPTDVAAEAVAFDAPLGDGRSGSNGIVLASPAGWDRTGTSWMCDYTYSGTATGVSFIHPLGQGHVIATVFRGVRLGSAVEWGYALKQKRPMETTPDYEGLTDKAGLPTCQLESRLQADGSYSLRMNGKLVATAKIDDIKAMTFSEDFKGDGLQRQLPPGQAGVVIGSMDGGTNRAENITFAVLAPSSGSAAPVQVASAGDPPTTTTPAPERPAPEPPAGGSSAVETEPKSDWKPPTKNSKAVFRSFLGIYHHGQKKNQYYPVVNLSVPDKNLWTQEIQDKVRGAIPFEEIAYLGTAKIIIPEDGVYVLGLANRGCQVSINGKDTGGPGELRLAGGIHLFTLTIGTHGQPYLDGAGVSLKHKETGEEVAFVNSWQEIQQFMSRRIAGVPVAEVSGWEPSEDKEVDLTPRRRR